ncbi:MAG: monovalent cation/H(+) antiporter subunit G [Epulopiscium sp.]|jgi:multicomponent Na+:H+ antiporter subunit G|nr:monovalent cation/H(+) antiporter subunit G [Candidatus Epulonipiscium sp.]
MIREGIAAVLILSGMFVFFAAIVGVYRFRYVLNRMHAAAMGDTLGILLVLSGLIVLGLDAYHIIKMILVIIFLWLTSPVSSHLIGKVEVLTNEHFEERVRGK